MAWYNPATWTPVDNVQDSLSLTAKTGTNILGQAASGRGVNTSSGGNLAGGGVPLVNAVLNNAPQSNNGSAPAQTWDGGATTQEEQGGVQQADPYARYGGTAAYNALKNGFLNQKTNIYGSANDAASALEGGLRSNVLDIIHGLTTGQQGIDRRATENEAAKFQGTQGILGMVGRGIKSGGVMLANKNAGSSSAAGALASAYGDQGRRELSKIGNQYEAGKADVATAQAEQDYQLGRAPEKFNVELMGNVNSIVNEARNKFAELDAAVANASLPDRIAIEQEKESVRQQVLGRLQQYDTQLRQGVSGIKASDQATNQAKARQMATAGVAPENSFDFNDQAPGQFQNTGPFASSLPIFTYRGKTEQMA